MKGTLKVLMFKHLVVRVRRFIHTAVELISPTVFFIILFSFKDYINEPSPKHAMDVSNIYKTEPIALESVHGPELVFYTPDNNVTRQLMERVGEKLGLKRLKYFPAGLRGRGFYPIADVSELREQISGMDERQAVVVFERLEYTIRMKNDFMTHIYNSLDDEAGPHANFAIIYEPFMRLQWAIDSSYLQMTTGVNINQVYRRLVCHQFT
ncbi:unnamed protein product, partial [Iphiclides podalirius]